MRTVKLDEKEIKHILALIYNNESKNEVFYGSKNQYWKRSEEIKKKLLPASIGLTVCPSCGREHQESEFYGFCCDACYSGY